MAIRTSKIFANMTEREKCSGGKIAQPWKREACKEAHRQHGVICFDPDSLDPDTADWIEAIARQTGHIGDGL